ncbi:MAG: hypothetical protein JHC26_11705 [Thermofilum sp.]|jgi:hypothetical protein|uniref:hypothetical protein n=1 Tax=Thermofilum sp. TaxID=1961369 RepID=UPI0025911E94|nr:hypothetical protein [Thermofilum sp.]MCI4409748.1 hypothetical protein [Thermofilum sp.]
MAQEFIDKWSGKGQVQNPIWKKEMNEVIRLLDEFNIDYKVQENRIKIVGDLRYASITGVPTLVIYQGNTSVGYDEYMDTNRLLITAPGRRAKYIYLPKSVHAEYDYPYLIIIF